MKQAHSQLDLQKQIYFEPTPTRIKILFLIFCVLAIVYFNWRIHTLNPNAIIFSSLMLLAEVYGLATGLAHFMMTWRLTVRKSTPPLSNQTVDIFIPTYNESIDIVRRTLAAAVNMDYPHVTWLLDDGNRPEFKQLAESMGARYLARPTHEHAKAGNLNYGLAHSSGEFIGIFDADHVPNKRFISAVLGYFSNPNVAFVQTPQDFYNLDSYQHRMNRNKGLVWTEQSLFFRVIQRGKDYWNAAFFCGSCALVRRSCLNEIGGFATDTITEDLHTSIRLHKKGYQSVYHEESLAFGIAPSTIEPFITQRIRWGQGAMQVWKKEGIAFDRKLTIAQKINYLASLMTYFDGWQKGFLYITPVIVLCTGWVPISTTGLELIIHLVPYVLINFLLTEELARGYGRTLYIEQYNMARFYAFAYATLSLVIPKKLTFKVTNKENNYRVPRKFLFPQRLVLYANILAIPVGLLLFQLGDLSYESFGISVFWALFNALLAGSVLSFSKLKQSFKRSSYRFSLPNPILIDCPEGAVFATMDEISSDGCKIYGDLPNSISKDSLIKGIIYFPGMQFAFSASVINIYRKLSKLGYEEVSIGCRFNWDQTDARQALEKYLFSANQFAITKVTEKDLTPIEKSIRIFKLDSEAQKQINQVEWRPLLNSRKDPIGVIESTFKNSQKRPVRAILNQSPPAFLANTFIATPGNLINLNLMTLTLEKSEGFDYAYYICEFSIVDL